MGESGTVIIKAFNPAAFTLGADIRKYPAALPDGSSLQWEGATWSRSDPDLLYIAANNHNTGSIPYSGMKLYSYRPSTDAYTLVKDFAPAVPGASNSTDWLFEIHFAANDTVFTAMQKRTGTDFVTQNFIVWERVTDTVTVIPNASEGDLYNNAVPDKSGRWVYLSVNNVVTPRGILDLQTDTWDYLQWDSTDAPFGHGDQGTAINVGRDSWTSGIAWRSLASPHVRVQLFDMRDALGVLDLSNDQHITLAAEDETWLTMGTFDDADAEGAETGAFEDEIMQVKTDGSGSIRRFAHTRTSYLNVNNTNGYRASPHATISQDGRYIAYTSNWENSGRYDMFIVQVPGVTPRRQSGGGFRGRGGVILR